MHSIKDYIEYGIDKIRLGVLSRTNPEAARDEYLKPIMDLYENDETARKIFNEAFKEVLKNKHK